jgi:hypothetical protein
MRSTSTHALVPLVLLVLAATLVSCATTGATGASSARAVAGAWNMVTDFRGTDIDAVMHLSIEDGRLHGTWHSQGQVMELHDLVYDDGTLTFVRRVGESELLFEGAVEGDTITGTYRGGFGELDSNGTRAN